MGRTTPPDPHSRPVPREAWARDEEARRRGRVVLFNATLPGGTERFTFSVEQYELLRGAILDAIDAEADKDGSVALQVVVGVAQELLRDHPAFPNGRIRNYATFTKVDLEAREEVVRLPGSPQRIRRSSAPHSPA